MTPQRPANVLTLKEILPPALRGGYGVGSFSPRYPLIIPAVLRAAQALKSPVIVQISQKDMSRCGVLAGQFAEAFYHYLKEEGVTVPIVLHLDHTEDLAVIEEAISVGFSSVMIDASDKNLEENIATTRSVVDYGHAHGVSVEGELGTIGAYSFSEAEMSEEAVYTDPDELERFAKETQVDAVAVSVGTMHGIKADMPISIDLERLEALRAKTSVPLVLHGGSGIPAEVMRRAIGVGGVSKVNLATDLEKAMLEALGSDERLVNAQIETLSPEELERARAAVERVTREKIGRFLMSEGQASS